MRKKGRKQQFFNNKFVIRSFRILRLFWAHIVHLHCSLMFFWGRKWYCSSFGLYSYAEMNTMRWCAVGCHCNWVNIGSSCLLLLPFSCCKTLGQFFFHREMSVSSQPLPWLTATIKTLREREQELSSVMTKYDTETDRRLPLLPYRVPSKLTLDKNFPIKMVEPIF